MDVFKAIKGRRSIREFLPDEVSQKDLELILDMARYAPTAGNNQPWKFLLVQGDENKGKIRAKIAEYVDQQLDAQDLTEEERKNRKANVSQYLEKLFIVPVLIFVFVDTKQYPDLVLYDGALAAQNMMLAAHALGYGSCFMTTFFPEELIRNYFSIPDHYKLICAIPVGKAAKQPEMPKKKDLNSFIMEEQFSS